LTKCNADFHTLPLPEDRVLKVIIKGLTNDLSESQISDELSAKGYEVKSVRQFANSIRKFQIHLITLTLNPFSKQIFNETSLFYTRILVESYRSNKPAQCYSCQRFGHSSFYCGYAPRCVKCSGTHLAKDCSKPLETDPKCANCEGSHTANYSKCPSFLEVIEAKRPKKPTTSKPPSNSDFPSFSSSSAGPSHQAPVNYSTPSVSYAAKVASTSPKTDSLEIVAQLTELIANISSGKISVKDAVVAILNLLPLLLKING
jgi:hypothetical protein